MVAKKETILYLVLEDGDYDARQELPACYDGTYRSERRAIAHARQFPHGIVDEYVRDGKSWFVGKRIFLTFFEKAEVARRAAERKEKKRQESIRILHEKTLALMRRRRTKKGQQAKRDLRRVIQKARTEAASVLGIGRREVVDWLRQLK